MKTAYPCLAGLSALALALTVAGVPAPVGAADPAEKPPARDLTSPYAHTAIGAVLDANGGEVPATGAELVRILAKLGDFVQLPVTFSAVALDSGLTHPRVVITMRPSTHPVAREGSAWESGGEPTPGPLNHTAPNRTQLEGRLFLAANTEPNEYGNAVVKTVEFISWNSRKLKFDFGVIEGMGGTPELKILDGVRCFSCHKNRGPILGISPWSNTLHNRVIQDIAEEVNHPLARIGPFNDGMDLFDSHAVEVDAAVRRGGDLLRDREVFRQLVTTAEGRRALLLLFGAILTPDSLTSQDKRIKKELDALAPLSFVRDAQAVRRAALPSALRDFRLPSSVIRDSVGGGINSPRIVGSAALPMAHVPSNPKAFVQSAPKALRQPSDAVSAVVLAQTIGLSESDRDFLTATLDETVKWLNNPALTRATVATAIFAGPAFADVLTTGILPDRDDFKHRFVAGILAVLKSQKLNDDFWAARTTYASSPKFDPGAKPEKEVVTLPSHACLACHDVRGSGKPAFNPIPMLAFDPFDATGRSKWLKHTDRKKKVAVLGRMLKRLGTDKDMPPEDSTESEMYRVKDPAALNAVKDWLDAELKRAKAN